MDVVNPVPVDEVEPWLAAVVTTLLGSPWDDDFAGASSGGDATGWPTGPGACVTTAGGSRRWPPTRARITVPGAPGTTVDVAADALTAVTVAATHRRRGLLTAMITQSLQQAVDRGDPVSILIAAEWPIYGRFGYAPASGYADYTLHTRRAGASVAPDPAGTVRQVDSRGAAGGTRQRSSTRSRSDWAGQVDRPGDWWSRRLGLDGYQQLSEGARAPGCCTRPTGEPDGFVAWRVERDFELHGVLRRRRGARARSPPPTRAYRNLWAYLCALDVVGEVAPARPAGRRAGALAARRRPRARAELRRRRHLAAAAGRARRAVGARRTRAEGRLVLEVVDDEPGRLRGGPVRCSTAARTARRAREPTRSPDLRLSQRALASTYLGEHALRKLAVAGGVDELAPSAVTRARRACSPPPAGRGTRPASERPGAGRAARVVGGSGASGGRSGVEDASSIACDSGGTAGIAGNGAVLHALVRGERLRVGVGRAQVHRLRLLGRRRQAATRTSRWCRSTRRPQPACVPV